MCNVRTSDRRFIALCYKITSDQRIKHPLCDDTCPPNSRNSDCALMVPRKNWLPRYLKHSSDRIGVMRVELSNMGYTAEESGDIASNHLLKGKIFCSLDLAC